MTFFLQVGPPNQFTDHTKTALSRGPNFLTQGPESRFTFCQTHRTSFGCRSRTVELQKLICRLFLAACNCHLPWFHLVMTDNVVVHLPSHKLDYSSVVSLKFSFKKFCVFLSASFSWWIFKKLAKKEITITFDPTTVIFSLEQPCCPHYRFLLKTD